MDRQVFPMYWLGPGCVRRYCRTRCGISRRKLADALGVHHQTAGHLERGEYSPSLYLALRTSRSRVEVIFSTEPFHRLGTAAAA